MRSSTRHRRAHAAGIALVALTLVASACSTGDKHDAASTTTTARHGVTTTTTRPSDGILTIGTLLPQTGALKASGPAEFAGVDLAVQDVNDAGGVLGHDVAIVHGDSGDASTDLASQTVSDLLDHHVDAIVGPSSTAVTLTVMDRIADAGVVEISPADHDDIASTADRRDRYFRTSAPMRLQAQVLSTVVADDGAQGVAVLAASDPYGDAFSDALGTSLTRAGIDVVATRHYDPRSTSFDADASAIADAKPGGIVVIGFEESSKVLAALVAHHLGPKDVKVYGVDGNMQPTLADGLPPGALATMKGTVPLVDVTDAFRQRLLGVDGSLTAFESSAESYDAVVLLALAAIANHGDDGQGMAKALIDVSRRGTKCTTFKACAALVRDGTDIDYDGVSGPIDLDDRGDPTKASIAIREFAPDGTLRTLEYRMAGAQSG